MMDQMLADTLTANLKHAAMQEANLDALVLADLALVYCQRKTSERVKSLCADRQSARDKLTGGKFVLWCIVGLANSGLAASLVAAAVSAESRPTTTPTLETPAQIAAPKS